MLNSEDKVGHVVISSMALIGQVAKMGEDSVPLALAGDSTMGGG